MIKFALARQYGAYAFVAALAGCAGQTSGGAPVPPMSQAPINQTSPTATQNELLQPTVTPTLVFTANRDGQGGKGGVLAFSVTASGNVAPAETITGSNTGLFEPDSLALDKNGYIYAASDSGATVDVFAPNSHGNAKPSRTIGGPKVTLGATEGLAIDPSGDLWVSDYLNEAILEFAPAANGNVAPIATIGGAHTQLNTPIGMAFASDGDLYVANRWGASIVAFAKGTHGNATPILTIAGSNTHLNAPFAVAFDPAGRLLVADKKVGVLVFAAGAKGNVAPFAVIPENAGAYGVAAAPNGHVWVALFAGSIEEFEITPSGQPILVRNIAGSNTTLSGATFLAFH